MSVIINIPNVNQDERIGSVFNHLFHVIHATENCGESDVQWDFKHVEFLHPFFLAPLSIFRSRCEKLIACTNVSESMAGHFNRIRFYEFFNVDGSCEIGEALAWYSSKDYTPICRFGLADDVSDTIQSIYQNIIEQQCGTEKGFRNPLSYLFSELVCNINQHSKGKHGYLFSQFLEKEKCVDVCIADDGITIYGSYTSAKKYLDQIGCDEAEALKLANEGYSTKNLPDAENRGYGIPTSKAMLVDGMKGGFFMLSGGAFHRYDTNGKVFVNLPEGIEWEGTIILMRIPIDISSDFDYMDYIS